MNDKVGADHQFHEEEYVEEWTDRFIPTAERVELFNLFLSELKLNIPSDGCVIELGIGPGYLADHLLRGIPGIKYYGVDFSLPMLGIAKKRLGPFSDRITYIPADIVQDIWWEDIPKPINAIVSTWALHDLGRQEYVEVVYKSSANALQEGGILLNGDFIKPDKAVHEFEQGRFEIYKHIEILRRVGFDKAECLKVFEEEIGSPTPSQNYACIKAMINNNAMMSMSGGIDRVDSN